MNKQQTSIICFVNRLFVATRMWTVGGIVILGMGLASIAHGGTPIYVDAARPDDSGNGLTPATAKKYIASGINTVDTYGTVIVAAGTYTENIVFPNKYITVQSTDPMDASVRAATIVDGGGLNSVFYFNNVRQGNTLKGFTIQNGGSASDYRQEGGGIRIEGWGPTIEYNTIKNNKASTGSGVHVEAANNAIIRYNTISYNDAGTSYGFETKGGGVYITQCSPTISSNTISYNKTRYGAGIMSDTGYPTINGNTIEHNTAQLEGGGVQVTCGAVALKDNVISENQVTSGCGGGIFAKGTAVGVATVTVTGNIIEANHASDNGGGVFFSSKVKGSITGNSIANNTASANSGVFSLGLYPNYVSFNVTNNWWGTVHGPEDAQGTIEMPSLPKPAVSDMLNAEPLGELGNAVSENVDYFPWVGSQGSPVIVYVDDSFTSNSCDSHEWEYDAFTSIQDGINAVAEGGTVIVAAGTYYENLIISKSINLLGPNAGINPNTQTRGPEAIISKETVPGGQNLGLVNLLADSDNTVFDGFEVRTENQINTVRGIEINGANNVTIKNTKVHHTSDVLIYPNNATNLLVEHCELFDADDFAVKPASSLSPTGFSSDVTIRGCTIHDVDDGVWVYKGSRWTIESNTIYNVGLGITLDSGGDHVARNNRIYAFKTAGIKAEKTSTIIHNTITYSTTASTSGYYGSGIAVKAGFAEGVIKDNIIVSCKKGIYFRDSPPPPTVTLDYNNVWDNPLGNYVNGFTPGANDISADPLFIDAPNGDLRLGLGSPALNAASDGLNIGAWQGIPAPPPPTVVWVDNTYTSGSCDSHDWEYDAFTSIQDGIDAVAEGGTVNVAAGTYTENLVIRTPVTLLGSGSGMTILDGEGRSGSVVTMLADDTIVSGFTVQNSGSMAEDAGIMLHGVSGCRVAENTSLDNANGIAMILASGNVVSNNTVYSNTHYGISMVASTGNTIVGNDIANNTTGLQIDASWQADVWIQSEDNVISINKISANTSSGIQCGAEQTADVHAVNNWWDAADGPSGSGPGSGDAVADGIVFTPWYTDAELSNLVPYDLNLDPASIGEHTEVGSAVGQFVVTDDDVGDSHVFRLVNGDGMNDVDNACFVVSGAYLLTAVELDYETKASYTVFAEVDDGQGGTNWTAIVINIVDENNAPVAGTIRLVVVAGHSLAFDAVAYCSDADGDPLTVTVLSPPAGLDVERADGLLAFTGASSDIGNTVAFDYTVSDGILSAQGRGEIEVVASIEEYLNKALVLTSVAPAFGNASCALRFPAIWTEEGVASYDVLQRPDLMTGTWAVASEAALTFFATVDGFYGEMHVVVPIPDSATTMFYKVQTTVNGR
ncbi:MAG: right-handed parallel beta-helix repeat-containing protein [Kiritimatiellia bacterium]